MALIPKTLSARTVATAGTPVALSASSLLVYAATVQSLSTNSGSQYLGDSTVDSSTGMEIKPGDIAEIEPPAKARGNDMFDLSKWYVDSSSNGAEFRVIAWINE